MSGGAPPPPRPPHSLERLVRGPLYVPVLGVFLLVATFGAIDYGPYGLVGATLAVVAWILFLGALLERTTRAILRETPARRSS